MPSERRSRSATSPIGGGAPVVVQSMTLTPTHDVEATTAQIAALASAGCELVRVRRPEERGCRGAADARPLLADPRDRRHPLQRQPRAEGDRRRRRRRPDQPGQHRRAGQGRAGRARRRSGPGSRCASAPTPARSRSTWTSSRSEDQAEALVAAALEEVELLERLDYRDFKISVKATHVPTMIRAYRCSRRRCRTRCTSASPRPARPSPGRSRAPSASARCSRTASATRIRVSLTADPVKEVEVAWEILKALGLRERGPVMIACPSCGRDNVGVEKLAARVEERLKAYPQAFEVAVMGCAVNGPGEAGDADFGIAGGRDVGFVYAHGRVLKKVSSDILVDELFHEIDRWIEGGMPRPKRLKMAKPAALAMAEASPDPARVACARQRARLAAVPPDPARRSGGRRGGQPQAARARGLHPPGQRAASGRSCRSAGASTARSCRSSARRWTRSARQEMLMPVLTPAELWKATGRYEIPEVFKLQDRTGRRVRAADDARGDGHVPRARDPELQAAPAALVPLPDEGPRRAAAPRRACSASVSSS